MYKLELKHKVIYERLQDDESRELFMCRYKYFKYGNYDHLWDELDIANKYNKSRKTNMSVKKDVWDLIENYDLCNSGVALFGAGANARFCLNVLRKKEIKVKAVCDSEIAKHGQMLGDYQIILPEEMVAEYPDIPIIITPTYQRFQTDIQDTLSRLGISDEFIFYFNSIKEKQYFGPDFMHPVENEVYIDEGCYDGETIMDFFEFAGIGKVYGFEPDPYCYEKTIERFRKEHKDCVKILKKGLWDSTETKRFDRTALHMAGSKILETGASEISTIALDEVINPIDRPTFIKMDIEGAELKALKGAQSTIRHCLPRLAICVYHKPEDIVDIPGYILSISQDYKFYIRHHVPWVNNETVLYAIP